MRLPRACTYSKRSLESDLVLLDALNGSIGNGGLAILDDGGNIDGLPSNRNLLMRVSGCVLCIDYGRTG